VGTTRREKEKWDLGDISLSLVSDPCPLAYKREGEDPHGKNVHLPTQHFAARDLGARFLSRPFVTSAAKFSARAQAARTGRRDILPEPL
jgi:hypothetical protein